MRIKFVDSETRYQASKECLWASTIVKVFGGFVCFESVDDYKNWKGQL